MQYIRRAGWTQNKLKIAAAVSMLLDHIGAELFPHMLTLRILGRLAFPIFSYFVYEGFLYTHSKRKYLLRIFGMGVMCVIAYYLYAREFYGNILITYSLSLIVLCGIHTFQKNTSESKWHQLFGILSVPFCLCFAAFACLWMPIDYGFFGVLLPAFAEVAGQMGNEENKHIKLVGFSIGLLLLSIQMGGIQFFSLLALPLLILYNGNRGVANLKHFFYWFYPMHLAIIGMIALIVG